jgi:hypothetical protein
MDTLIIYFEKVQKEWEINSHLLIAQLQDIRAIEQQAKGPWKATLNAHIEFLIHLNNCMEDFKSLSKQLILHQQLQLGVQESVIKSLTSSDASTFKELIKLLKKKQCLR